MTKTKKILDLLESKGMTEVMPSASNEYRQFVSKNGNYYWLGKSGDLRRGQDVETSLPCNPFPNKQQTKAQIYRSLGLVAARGAVSGKVYWE